MAWTSKVFLSIWEIWHNLKFANLLGHNITKSLPSFIMKKSEVSKVKKWSK